MGTPLIPAAIIVPALIGLSFVAQAPQKRPWEWTVEERIAARRDPAQRLERVRAMEARVRSTGAATRVADVIDGATNPELFLPSELFEVLVRSAFVSSGRVGYTGLIREQSSDLFRHSEEWERFAPIVSEFARLIERELGAASNLEVIPDLLHMKCVAAAQALRESRRVFGAERFDRLLYETVPKHLQTTYSIDTDFERSLATAQRREDGCR